MTTIYICIAIMNLLPPAVGQTYSSLEDLLLATNKHASSEGYAITIKRTKKSKKGSIRKAWLRCDKGSKYTPKGYGKREAFSRQLECPFSIIAIRDIEFETWSFQIENPAHNHEPTIKGAHQLIVNMF